MATGKVTKKTVDDLMAATGRACLWDTQLSGFGVKASTSGSKSYVYQYRMGGREAKTRVYTIGRHGSPWTPDAARKEAERIAILVRQGTDPMAAARARRKEAVEFAFSTYVKTFVDGYLKVRWKQWGLGEGILLREAVPVLRDKPLPRITRGDLAPIWDRLLDRPAVARLAHATLRKLFRWAVNRGDLDRSPMEGMEAPPPVPSRDRVLSDEELKRLWLRVENLGASLAAFYRLLILTGQRREEVAGINWDELDRDAATWTLPGPRTKNAKAHIVPLSSLAIQLLDDRAGGKTWPSERLLFTRTGKTAFSGFSKAKARLDALLAEDAEGGVELEPWRVHDLRRTVATGLQRLGVRFEVTEAVLNHVSGAKAGVAGVYQRHNWSSEKRVALNKWARHLSGLLEGKPQAKPRQR